MERPGRNMLVGYQEFAPLASRQPLIDRGTEHPWTNPFAKPCCPSLASGRDFLPATKAIPKEMLTVVDRPILQYVVDEAREAGIEHFIFVTGRNKGVIEDHFDYATTNSRIPSSGAANRPNMPP